jgi:hypothetical protein
MIDATTLKTKNTFLFKMNGRGKKSSCLAAKSGKK